jgi:hypothetical protein
MSGLQRPDHVIFTDHFGGLADAWMHEISAGAGGPEDCNKPASRKFNATASAYGTRALAQVNSSISKKQTENVCETCNKVRTVASRKAMPHVTAAR